MNNLYRFEVTPFHPTRKVYDNILWPDVIGYEKDMTVQQALATMCTCGNLKVQYKDKWYPVKPETIDEIVAVIDKEEEMPAGTEVEPALRAVQSYLTVVPEDENAYGKAAGYLGDIKIENGDVSGIVYPVTGYTGFNGVDVNEQSGYYLAFGWVTNNQFTDAKMRVVNGKHPESKLALDPINVVMLGKGVEDGGCKIVEITAKDTDGNEVIFTFDSSRVIFSNKPSPYVAPQVAPDPVTPAKLEDEVVG